MSSWGVYHERDQNSDAIYGRHNIVVTVLYCLKEKPPYYTCSCTTCSVLAVRAANCEKLMLRNRRQPPPTPMSSIFVSYLLRNTQTLDIAMVSPNFHQVETTLRRILFERVTINLIENSKQIPTFGAST